jgi:hypothetical protein
MGGGGVSCCGQDMSEKGTKVPFRRAIEGKVTQQRTVCAALGCCSMFGAHLGMPLIHPLRSQGNTNVQQDVRAPP